MKRRHLLVSLAALPLVTAPALAASPFASAPPQVVAYKSPYCGCCTAWVTHMEAAGFAVKVEEVLDTGVVRSRLGMPDRFSSCHTATVGGYALEGHVPAAEVKLLLALKSDAVGLAVPGMPMGSPGMEAGGRVAPYEVLLVGRAGESSVFARHPKG